MRIIRPMTVNNAQLTSSSVPETDYSLYNPATTYALGDRRMLVSPSSVVSITIGTPAAVSWVAHGLAADTPITLATTGNLPSGLTAGQRVFISSTGLATDSFQVSATAGGTSIITSGSQSGVHTATAEVHEIYESLQASNTGHYPSLAASSTWWLDIGANNRWKMFDGSVTSQSSAADTISCTFLASGRVDAVAVLNVSAASVRVTMTDATDGLVYDKTKTLTSYSGIHDPYAYCFEPIVRNIDCLFTDMPPYANATVTVTLTDTGQTVLCGACVLGFSSTIGGTQYGANVGIQDYSIKQRDAFGNYTILQRAFNKRANFSVWLDNQIIDQVQNVLAQYRATPTLYVGSDGYASTFIYGFFKDFSVAIEGPVVSVCNIELEGLT